MFTKENYIIVCDESTKKGQNYSYFYGGAILKEAKYEKISALKALRGLLCGCYRVLYLAALL